MKYAIIRLGGKQFMVSEGDIFEIERQQKLNIDVLAFSDGKSAEIGDPVVKDVMVKAKILEDRLDKKVRVARFKSKSRYRKNKGHRQPISVIKIEKITHGTEPKEKKAPAKKAETKAKTSTTKKATKPKTTKTTKKVTKAEEK